MHTMFEKILFHQLALKTSWDRSDIPVIIKELSYLENFLSISSEIEKK